MKLAFLNEQKKDNQKFCEHLNQRGFMVIQEQPEQKSYDALIDSYRKLTKRSIDYLMLDQFTSDFNYFLDYLNPKEIKKQKFDVVGNGFTTTMLNYVAMLNQNIRVLYGPTFNHFTKPNEAAKIYDNFAYIISKTEKQVIIDAKKTNPDLLFAFTKKTAGILYGGHVDALIASYNTDYFPAKLKGECTRYFSTWAMQKSRESVENPLEMHEKIVEWLIENWLDAIKSLKQVKSEPEMVSLTLIHIAAVFTNGYLKCPINNIEVSVRMIKTLITVNFWEEGNPHSPEPIKH
jgi:hypothetical protein